MNILVFLNIFESQLILLINLLLYLVIKQEELDYIRQIKEENIKLKELIRFKDREIGQKASESEAVIIFPFFRYEL